MPSSIGLPRGTVRVVAYDSAWPACFADEIERLTPHLHARGLVVTFEHTGSTAVPGLVAKPIIDILVGWLDEQTRADLVTLLRSAGYSCSGEQGIPGRDFYRRGDPPMFHLHSAGIGSAFWHDHLDFRNRLRTDPEVAQQYGRLKSELAVRFATDRDAYIEAKTAFVEAVLKDTRQRR